MKKEFEFSRDDLAKWSGGEWLAPPSAPIVGFCFDSRQLKPGEMFVALKSEKSDGHRFVSQALAAGAAAALVERGSEIAAGPTGLPLLAVGGTLAAFQRIAQSWRRQVNPFIVGVTGSVGKSTVKEWTAAILSDWRKTCATKANFNNDIGLPASLLSISPDTKLGVFEAGISHHGDMRPLAGTMQPNAAVVTSIAPVHIEFFQSLEGIADEKAGLLRALPEDGFAVLDARGAFFSYLSSQCKCRVIGVCAIRDDEAAPSSALYVARIHDEATCSFSLEGPGLEKPIEVVLGRPGGHNALNAALAAAAAHECGAPWSIVAARLASLPGISMRWERFSRHGIDWICDAYNANPIAMAASIRAFAMSVPPGTTHKPRVFALGSMFELGKDEVEYHKGIGKTLGEIETCESDVLICAGSLAANYASPAFKGKTIYANDALDVALALRREQFAGGATVLLKASHGLRLDSVPGLYETPLPELQTGGAGVAVMGAGRSGLAAKAMLESIGAKPIVLDGDMPFPEGNISLAIVSPGIPSGHQWLEECARRGIRAISELELGWLFWRGKTIAVTGSKGKSSVVKFIADALCAAGRDAAPCGNYGTPFSELALSRSRHEWAVAEASSFQLERIDRFRPDIAVLLNIQADHLDRHGTMEAYAMAKRRIFKNQRRGLEVAIDAGDFAAAAEDGGSVERFGAYFGNKVLAPAAAAAEAALLAAGLTKKDIAAAFAAFHPLPHRMQMVAEKDGTVFIDNSKATSLAALAASVEMASRPVRLIAGGRLKESELSAPKKILEKQVKKVYLIGEASHALFEAWSKTVPCEECATMQAAVAAAAGEARPCEAILLAPGCASFDQFGGYAERGDVFTRSAIAAGARPIETQKTTEH